MTDYDKPLPPIDDPIQGPYWAAARDHRLVLQRCEECGAHRWPPSPTCPECLTIGGSWDEVPSGGVIWSFAIYDRAYRQEYRHDLPYDVALIELDAGPKMISNVVGVAVEDLRVGMRVEAHFDDVTPEVTLVRFSPSNGDDTRGTDHEH